MRKKSKIIAGGILITSAIGAIGFAIMDPYNILSKKNIDVSEKSSNFTDSTSKDKRDDNTLRLNEIKDGTYFGVSKGYGGDVKVKVTIENSKIKNIEVISHSETPKYYENGSKVIASILKENSINVDSVSGATLTSNGIKNAVRDALYKAGIKVDENNKEVSIYKNNSKIDHLKAKNNIKNIKSIDLKEYKLKDGEYIGEAIGFKGNVKVKVIIRGNKLVDVKVISHNEDLKYFNKSKGIIIKILKNQGTAGVDTVSGATYSSKGILNAVNSALNKIDKKNNDINNTIKISKKKNKYEENNIKSINIKDIVIDILDKNGIKENENRNISSKEHKLKDGEYIGEAKGFKGNVKLKTIIKDGTLVNIEIINHNDDDEFFNNAKGVVLKILKNQNTVGVDTISGATYSSKGIIDAVNSALKESMSTNNKVIIEFTIDGKGKFEGEKRFETNVGKTWKEEKVVAPKPVPAEGYVFDHWDPKIPDGDKAIEENKTYKAIFVKKVDKTALDALIAKKVDIENKRPAIIADYKEKLKAAKVVSADKNATQSDVDNAKKNLKLAIDNSVEKVDKSELKKLISKKNYLSDKTYDTVKVYNEKKKDAESVLTKENATQEEVTKAVTKLKEAINGLKISPLRTGEVYDVSARFASSVDGLGGHVINQALQKTEVKLNKNGKINVTMIFKPQEGLSFLNKGRFIIKNGEKSESLKPEIKDGLEIFKFTLPTFDERYKVDVFLPSKNLFGNNASIIDLFWNTLRPSGTVAPETNPLKPGNDYVVMVEFRHYNHPDFKSMADQYLEKPSTISVDKDGVAKLTFRMREKFSNTIIYSDKKLSKMLTTKNVDKETTFVLPTYNKEGFVWATSYVFAMGRDVNFGIKINWETLSNTKEKMKMLTRNGIVSGKFGLYDRKYPINVSILVDEEKNIIKDLIVTNKESSADNYYMEMATKGILTKILGKPATIETVRGVDSVSGATISSKAIKETMLTAFKENIDENNKVIIEFATIGNGKLEGKKVFKSEVGGTWKGEGVVVPKPVPDNGYFFDRWDLELPSDNETINENKTYKAIFVKKANKTELNALIAKMVDTENKVPTIVADYKEKLNAAKSISSDEKAKQSDVDKAKKNLELAIYALNIKKIGQAYDVLAKFSYSGKIGGNTINEALQKTEIKLNEDGKIDVTMIFKPKKGYSFINKGIFTIRDVGGNKSLKPEFKGEMEIFKFTLPKFDTKYNVTVKFPSESFYDGMAVAMELSWKTLRPVVNSSTES